MPCRCFAIAINQPLQCSRFCAAPYLTSGDAAQRVFVKLPEFISAVFGPDPDTLSAPAPDIPERFPA